MYDSGQMNLNVVKSYEQIVFMGNCILITSTYVLKNIFQQRFVLSVPPEYCTITVQECCRFCVKT